MYQPCATVASLCAVALLAGVCACGPATRPAQPPRLNLACAASLTDVLTAAGAEYRELAGVELECEFGSSGSLARKVSEGAPFDLFISANLKWMQFLQGQGLVPADGAVSVARNRLVCVAAPEAPTVPASAAELPALARVALGDPEHVPAGLYARQALQRLGVWPALESQGRLVLCQDVRAALTLVEQGAAQAGVVYATDARMNDRVQLAFTFPDSTHDPVGYWAAVLGSGTQAARAEALLRYLSGDNFRVLLERYGFSPP